VASAGEDPFRTMREGLFRFWGIGTVYLGRRCPDCEPTSCPASPALTGSDNGSLGGH